MLGRNYTSQQNNILSNWLLSCSEQIYLTAKKMPRCLCLGPPGLREQGCPVALKSTICSGCPFIHYRPHRLPEVRTPGVLTSLRRDWNPSLQREGCLLSPLTVVNWDVFWEHKFESLREILLPSGQLYTPSLIFLQWCHVIARSRLS